MFGLEPTHLIIVAVVVLVLFGSRRLPPFVSGLALGLRTGPQGGLLSACSPADQPLMRMSSGEESALSDPGFILLVAGLCDPRPTIRIAAARLLSEFLPDEADMLHGWSRQAIDRADFLQRLLDLRGISLDAAAAELTERLRSTPVAGAPDVHSGSRAAGHQEAPMPSSLRVGAVVALGVIGYPPAVPVLMERLPYANPEGYLTIVRALARLQAAEVVAILAALTIPDWKTWKTREFGRAELSPEARATLNPLLRAVRWAAGVSYRKNMLLATESTQLLNEPATVRSLYREACSAEDADLSFAADALWTMGEVNLLRSARQIGYGDASAIRAQPDPRLFEALALALADEPRAAGERSASRAAIEGLEALADRRCLAVLDAFGARWAAGPRRGITLACRAAARRLRERLASGRGEVAPIDAPAGSGSEITPGAGPPAAP